MDETKREGLSRLLSLMLRHKPDRFDLDMDAQGYAPVDEVLDAVRQKFADATREQILEVVDSPEKRRFEIKDDRVRARYGHSFPVDLGLEPMEPPEYLYFAAIPAQVGLIASGGLKPGDRQYIHLSMDKAVAEAVAQSRTDAPIVYRILAKKAADAGIRFYDRAPVYLAREIPPQFIEMDEESQSARSLLYGRRKRLKTPRSRPSAPAEEAPPSVSSSES